MGMLSGTTRGGRRAAVIGSLIVQLGFALACAAPGERARAADPRMPDADAPCPAGETCSALAPRGLYFSRAGAALLGGGPETTAVGGAQSISFSLPQSADLTAGVESGAAAVTLAPVVAANTRWDWTFTFRPSAVGSTTVAIRESATRALLDRIALEAAIPDRVTLRSGTVLYDAPLGFLWLGSAVTTHVDARSGSATGVPVFDEEWSMTSHTPSALAIEGRSLRGLLIGQWAARVNIGSTVLSTVVRVVETVDSLRVVGTNDRVARPSPWSFDHGLLHVQAMLGGVVVEGAPITVESARPTMVRPTRDNEEWLGDGVFIAPVSQVATPTRVPITLRCGSLVLRGEVLLTP